MHYQYMRLFPFRKKTMHYQTLLYFSPSALLRYFLLVLTALVTFHLPGVSLKFSLYSYPFKGAEYTFSLNSIELPISPFIVFQRDL